MNSALDIPVLVVGAGPVGLALSIDLGERGVNALLIEAGDGQILQSKIGHIAVRTMEFFRRWGIAQEVRDAGFPRDFRMSRIICTDITRAPLYIDAHATLEQMPIPAYACEKKQRCPQHWLQPILQNAVSQKKTIKVQMNTELIDFEKRPDHIIATLKEGHKTKKVRTQYMVACDGAESLVRQQLGIGMTGSDKLSYSIGITVRLPNWKKHCHYGPAERFIFLGPEGTWGNLTTIDGNELWRLTVYGNSQKIDLQHFDAHAWVRRALGPLDSAFDHFEVISVLPWRRREQIAEHFSLGRIFLAGDAAHVMSPTGGMGMNTGIGDAVDLGWKLQALLKGWGGDGLIESYGIERQPVAIRNANSSSENFKTLTSPSHCEHILDETALGEKARQEITADFATAMRERYWDPSSIQMGYSYDDSPLCISDGTPRPMDQVQYIQTSRPGARAPHAWLKQKTHASTLDLFGAGFTLLCFDETHQNEIASLTSSALKRGLPCSVKAIQDTEIAQLYQAPLILVRPDGHVAWRGERLSPHAAQNIIDTVIGIATH